MRCNVVPESPTKFVHRGANVTDIDLAGLDRIANSLWELLMNKRRLGLLGAFISLVFVLAACSTSAGTATTSTGSSTGNNQATSTSTSNGTTNANGTPIVGDTGSGFGTPMASPSTTSGQTVNLTTAFSNLKSQNSYVMTAKLSNLQGSIASIPGVTEQSTIKIERSGNDQHLTITSNDGNIVFQVWQVGDQVWADIGSGPVKVSQSNSMVAQFLAMVSADQQIVNSLESQDASYQASGTDTVNGTQANVETAQYQMTQANNQSMFFSSNGDANVNAKIWVAQDGAYLLKGDFTISANGNASSPAGSAMMGTPMSSTPSASGSAEVTLNVTQVGQVQSIQPPS